MIDHFIHPDWPAPARVHACCTRRIGGVSRAPWDTFNLALHVGDDPLAVQQNRHLLMQALGLADAAAGWLEQVHGTDCIRLDAAALVSKTPPKADASWTDQSQLACIIMTADCLPVLFTNSQGTRVAAAHAGWRGLLAGVLESTVRSFAPADQVMAWLGPAIGPQAFVVGPEVRTQFVDQQAAAAVCFQPCAAQPGHYLADLYGLARLRLAAAGVAQVYGGGQCTFQQKDEFFSYRRDGQTGRMASLIWLA